MDLFLCMLVSLLQKYRLGKQSGKDMGEASKDGKRHISIFVLAYHAM